jgi:hypothetical protein
MDLDRLSDGDVRKQNHEEKNDWDFAHKSAFHPPLGQWH